MKKYWWLVLIAVLLLPVLIYVYCEYKLHDIALRNVPNDIPKDILIIIAQNLTGHYGFITLMIRSSK